jgi:apolipoprotein N-acyltransferase
MKSLSVPKGGALYNFLYGLCCVVSGAVLFALSFPNPVFADGLPFLAWLAFFPVFFLLARATLAASVFWGALYGFGAYSLFNYWLAAFHPLAGLIVGIVYLVYFAFLFPVLKAAVILAKKTGASWRTAAVLQCLLFVVFEYLRTLGFLGYPYGIIGYSQWRVLPLIQVASFGGVWAVSALLLFPQIYAANYLSRTKTTNHTNTTNITKKIFIPIIYLALLISAIVYGAIQKHDFLQARQVKLALIQHHTDPWLGGDADYRKNYEVLKRLSLEALAADPDSDLVVWTETAFVPRIYWHTTYRDDHVSYVLVKELLDFLDTQNVPYLIGNDDGRREVNPETGATERVDYNAALLFNRSNIEEQYRKLHLVPFTEYFPYKKQLPAIYDWLESADTHFWKKGTVATVFEVSAASGSFKFSAPICFEDSFGYLSRDFVRAGARMLVNITNDAWSGSLSAQKQHQAMAVFRAVENRVPLVRAAASGQTCAIAPDGKIISEAAAFTEAYLNATVPYETAAEGVETFYTKHGDFLPKLFLAAAAAVLLVLGIGAIMRAYLRRAARGK